MDADAYQREALRSEPMTSYEGVLQMAALGLTGEAGEVADLIKKHLYHEHPLNVEKLVAELGDVAWYLAVLAHTVGARFSTVLEGNCRKLRERYPDGFTPERSLHRDTAAEERVAAILKNSYLSEPARAVLLHAEGCDDLPKEVLT